MNITADQYIYIIFDRRRQWLRKVIKNEKFHCDRGYLVFNEVIGKPFGHTYYIEPYKQKVSILQPLTSDLIFKMSRSSQIIYPEDIGLILTYGNITSGKKILEAGTGSGTVSSLMAKYSLPNGHVDTFDIRPKAYKQGKKNIEILGMKDNVNSHLLDLFEKVSANYEQNYEYQDENNESEASKSERFDLTTKQYDFIMLDLPSTWDAIEKLKNNISPNGRACLFSPTIEQVKKNIQAFKELQFNHITTVELMRRNFQVKPNATRPKGRMNGHSGYLTFATKSEKPLLSPSYRDFYTPEIVGNALIYSNVSEKNSCLLIHNSNSPLIEIINTINPKIISHSISINTENIADFDNLVKDINKIQFSTIILDNVNRKDIIAKVNDFLEPGGIVLSIDPYIENMKETYDQMMIADFRDVKSFELIKREIIFNEEGSFSQFKQTDSSGYITHGRKILDYLKDKKELDKEKENSSETNENEEKVGKDMDWGFQYIKKASEDEDPDEKIDYANLRE